MDKIKQLKNIIKTSNNIVLLTGAGISVPSGIPDFRSAKGIYNQKLNTTFKPEDIISHSFFMNYPKEFYDFYKDKMIYQDAMFNKAHVFFAELEKTKKLKAIITQNIDSLHLDAGSKNVLEIHGSVKRNYCMKCNKFYDINKILDSNLPYCECGGLIKPDVVLYEEQLDLNLLEKAISYVTNCDTFIVVGTSLIVHPAAGLLSYFKGNNLVLINKSKTNYDYLANLVINDDIINVINLLEGE